VSPRLHAALDVSLYPRTYRASVWSNLFLVVVYCLGVLGSLAAVVYSGIGPDDTTPGVRLFSVAFFAVLLVISVYGFLVTVTAQVVLAMDRIESKNYFSSKSMLREDIAGLRNLRTRYGSILVLVPRDETQKKLKISMYITRDAEFYEWLRAIPDLDVQDRQESLAQAAKDLGLGKTAFARGPLLAQGKATATTLGITTAILGVWSWFVPNPHWLVIFALGVLPLISLTLVIRFKGLYQLDEYRNDARPSLGIPFIMPGLFLVLRTLLGFDLLQVRSLVVASVLIALVLFSISLRYDPSLRKRRWVVILPLIFWFVYAYGALSQVNALADHSAPETFPVTVLSQRVSGGRSTTWYLGISAWGPVPSPSEVSVSSSLYRSVKPGDSVCVYLHTGALKSPWYYVSHCR